MKPEQLTGKIEALDQEARERREENVRQTRRRHEQDAARGELSAVVEERLEQFRSFIRTAAEDAALQPAESAYARHHPDPFDAPAVQEVVVGAHRTEELGYGLVVARVVPQLQSGTVASYRDLGHASAVETEFVFRPQNEFLGQRDTNRADTELGSELVSTAMAPNLNGVNDVDQREAMLARGRERIQTADARAEETLTLLETAARDASLNPELAERFAVRAPLPTEV